MVSSHYLSVALEDVYRIARHIGSQVEIEAFFHSGVQFVVVLDSIKPSLRKGKIWLTMAHIVKQLTVWVGSGAGAGE